MSEIPLSLGERPYERLRFLNIRDLVLPMRGHRLSRWPPSMTLARTYADTGPWTLLLRDWRWSAAPEIAGIQGASEESLHFLRGAMLVGHFLVPVLPQQH